MCISVIMHRRLRPLTVERACGSCRSCRPLYTNTTRLTRPSARLTTPAIDSPICAAYHASDLLAHPRRLTTPRPTHLSAPAADSDVIDFSFTMVIIKLLGDNC